MRTSTLISKTALAVSLVGASSFAHAAGSGGSQDGSGPSEGTKAPEAAKMSPIGKNALDSFHGAMTESIQVIVPAYHNLEPQLTLSYGSQGGDGAAGIGWSIGFDEVERIRRGGGSPAYDVHDTYRLGGQELYACSTLTDTVSPGCTSGGTHATKLEAYERIKLAGETWKVADGTGIVSTYEPLIRVSGQVFRWGLTRVEDRHGNAVTYQWSCVNDSQGRTSNCYPQRVSYGGNYARIDFTWETRPDVSWFANGRYIGKNDRRLKKIEVRAAGRLARTYQLSYDSSSGGKSRLRSVTVTGSDGTTSLPASRYEYHDDSLNLAERGDYLPTSFRCLENNECMNGVANVTENGGEDLLLRRDNGWDLYVASESSYTLAARITEPADMTGAPFLAGGAHALEDITGDGRADVIFAVRGSNGNGNGNGWRIYSYNEGQAKFEEAAFQPHPEGLYSSNLRGSSNALVDVTGDGRTDLVTLDKVGGSLGWSFFKGTGRGFQLVGRTPLPAGAMSGCLEGVGDLPENALQYCTNSLADVNGDGRTDLIALLSSKWSVYLSDGTQFVYAGEQPARGAVIPGLPNNAVADLNGDGRTDMLIHEQVSGVWGWTMFLSNGRSFDPVGFFPQPQGLFGTWLGGHFKFNALRDVNGDGVLDLMTNDTAGTGRRGFSLWLGTGSGFVWTWHVDSVSQGVVGCLDSSQCGNALEDVNGDGAVDLLRLVRTGTDDFGYEIWLGRGNSFALSQTLWLPRGELWDLSLRGGSIGLRDVTGDGVSDLVGLFNERGCTQGFLCRVGIRVVRNPRQSPGGKLVRVDNGLGGRTEVTYARALVRARGGAYLHTVVDSQTTDDGRGGRSTTRFQYKGGLYDSADQRFLGFRYVRAELPTLAGETAAPFNETWFRQDYGSISKVEHQKRWAGPGQLMSYEFHAYEDNGATIPYVSREIEVQSYQYLCTSGRRQAVSRTYDDFGHVVTETSFGACPTLTGPCEPDGDEKTIQYAYFPNRTDFMVDLPAAERLFDGVGTEGVLISESLTAYDNRSWNEAPTIGDATELKAWLYDPTTGSQSYIRTQKNTYDARGNVIISEAAPLRDGEPGVQTKTEYDRSYTLFPVKQTAAFGRTEQQITTSEWDLTCGQVSRTVDANNQPSTISFDALCRPVRADSPGGIWSTFAYRELGDPTRQHVETITAPGIFGRGYFDGQQRTYREERQAAIGTVATVTEFDARGNVARKALPHYAGTAPRWETTRYDAADRPVVITHADGHTQKKLYGLQSTTTVDEMCHQQVDTVDAYGRIVEHREKHGEQWISRGYGYNVRGQLVSVTDPLGNEIQLTYDSLDRKVEMRDPDAGDWRYGYDNVGRLAWQIDALGQRTALTYDGLSRKLSQTARAGSTDPEKPEEVSRWTYDQARASYFNRGRMTTAQDAHGVMEVDYDLAGRIVRKRRTILGKEYVFRYGYDSAGRPSQVTYPDGQVVTNSYDAGGQLSGISGYAADIQYDAAGQILSRRVPVTSAKLTLLTYSYDPDRQWLSGMKSAFLELGYRRDPEGKIVEITGTGNAAQNWLYAYDDLHRLVTASYRPHEEAPMSLSAVVP